MQEARCLYCNQCNGMSYSGSPCNRSTLIVLRCLLTYHVQTWQKNLPKVKPKSKYCRTPCSRCWTDEKKNASQDSSWNST